MVDSRRRPSARAAFHAADAGSHVFAEDIGLLEQYLVASLLDDCKSPADSYDLLGGLFAAMNTPEPDRRADDSRAWIISTAACSPTPARVELYDDELNQLKQAAKSDWSKVRPEIFGTLFEHSLDDKLNAAALRRPFHASGRHHEDRRPVDRRALAQS